MKAKVNLVDAAWMGKSFAADPDLLPPPARPRLIRELVIVPTGEDGLLFAGAERWEVIRGRSAITLLPRLLPQLDGSRTTDELAARCGLSPTTLRDVVALLYSRGLLEDGAPAVAGPPDLLSFLGRFTDVSRSNRHREQTLQRLEQAEVFVGGGALAERFAAALRGVAVGTVRTTGDASGADYVVAVAGDAAEDVSAVVDAAWAADVPCLHVRIGRDAAQIGPTFRPGQTGCYRCFVRLFGVPPGTANLNRAELWSGVAALQAMHYIAMLAKGSVHGGFRSFRVDAETGELVADAQSAPAIPGCAACGVPGRALDPDDPAFLAWAYHSLVRFPGRELLSPKEHQNHYQIANVQLATIESAGFAGAPATPLPKPAVTGSAPWLAGPLTVGDGRLDRATLASLLGRSAGWVDDRGQPRRVAPTGGSLGSVELFAVVRDVADLAPGVYYYNASRHALERLGDASDRELAAALGTTAALPPCLLVGTGSFAKTQQKYSAFGYRLIYLDAGVASTYVHAIAAAEGLATGEYADYDDDALAGAIRLPAGNAVLPTFAVGLGAKAAPLARPALSQLVAHDLVARCRRPARDATAWPTYPTLRGGRDVLRGLDRVLLTRRAIRQYAPTPLTTELATGLATLAADLHHHRLALGCPDVPVAPLVAVRLGTPELPAGMYRFGTSGLVAQRAGLTLDEMRECVIQNSLAAAPFAIYFTADLERGFARRGPRAYRDAAVHAGAMAAQVWLAATSSGLAACAAGGVAPSAISRLSGLDPYHASTLFAIFVGEPTGAFPTGSPA